MYSLLIQLLFFIPFLLQFKFVGRMKWIIFCFICIFHCFIFVKHIFEMMKKPGIYLFY